MCHLCLAGLDESVLAFRMQSVKDERKLKSTRGRVKSRIEAVVLSRWKKGNWLDLSCSMLQEQNSESPQDAPCFVISVNDKSSKDINWPTVKLKSILKCVQTFTTAPGQFGRYSTFFFFDGEMVERAPQGLIKTPTRVFPACFFPPRIFCHLWTKFHWTVILYQSWGIEFV